MTLPAELYEQLPLEPANAVLDWPTLMDCLGDDAELAEELVALYMQDGQQLIGQIEQMATTGNYPELTRLAHGLKGASANMHADWMRYWSSLLEEAGKHQDTTTIAYGLTELKQAFGLFQQVLSQYPFPHLGGQSTACPESRAS